MHASSDNSIPVYRPEDGEFMGLIRQKVDDETLWQPLTIFHYPLTDFMRKDEAVQYLQSYGLMALIDNWQFYDASDNEWYDCTIAEAKPEVLKIIISDYGHPDIHQARTITLPDEQKIRRKK